MLLGVVIPRLARWMIAGRTFGAVRIADFAIGGAGAWRWMMKSAF